MPQTYNVILLYSTTEAASHNLLLEPESDSITLYQSHYAQSVVGLQVKVCTI